MQETKSVTPDTTEAIFLVGNDSKMLGKHIFNSVEMFPVGLQCVGTPFEEVSSLFSNEITVGFQF